MAGRRGAPDDDAPSERQRIDKWLVYARFVKTRAAASLLVEDGRVRLNGVRMTRPDRAVKSGDVLTLALPHATQVVRITGLAERRGAAAVAQALYEDIGG